ncbi:MAG: hypothetical protein G01um101466_404 [Parcubacteria group bacterium Gr01-1014_66]|nr:MAG: hypothetical protein G01um101466_404 [Parcubacteria group bacterium Gr01-1014_66]
MLQNSRIQTLFFALIILLLGGIGVLWYMGSLQNKEDRSIRRHTIDLRVIGLRRLRNIMFDTGIFQEPGYQALHTVDVPILPEEISGSNNPFAAP